MIELCPIGTISDGLGVESELRARLGEDSGPRGVPPFVFSWVFPPMIWSSSNPPRVSRRSRSVQAEPLSRMASSPRSARPRSR